ncbi:MAG: hypothetical protein WA952_02670 [Lewinella sp.]
MFLGFLGVLLWSLSKPSHADFGLLGRGMIILACVVGTVGIGLFILGIHRRQLIVGERGIRKKGLFEEKFVAFSNIAGYRSMEYGVWLVSKAKKDKRMVIERDYHDPDASLTGLYLRYPNLEDVLRKEDRKAVLADRRLGASRPERKEALRRAQRQARIFNWLAVVIAIWACIYPQPYGLACGAAAVMPVLAFGLSKYSNGMLLLDGESYSARPHLAHGLFIVVSGLFLRGLSDYDIYAYRSLWPILLLVSSVLTFFIYWYLAGEMKNKLAFIFWIPIAVLYSYGTLIHYNCFYDDREAVSYPVEVLRKSFTAGSDGSCYLYLSAWREEPGGEQYHVGRRLYDRVEPSDTVQVIYRPGKVGVPWYRVVTAD